MKTIVIYKSKYGSTKKYAEWIAKELGCEIREAGKIRIEALADYDTIIYGGGLYAETIAGVTLITKNLEKLSGKKLVVFTTGITPLECREYYDRLVAEKNFKGDAKGKIKVFNFLGKMILDELSIPHRSAIKMLKKIMSNKENPTELEKLLVSLCDANGDFTDKDEIKTLLEYVREE